MSATEKKHQAILDAAVTQFSQYGYRKTSMEDIAREAGVSRPSLYSYFENKEEIFRCLSQHLTGEALEQARLGLQETRSSLPIAARIENALFAFSVSLFRRLDESPHGAELMDETSRLGGDIAQTFYAQFEALLAAELEQAEVAGEIDLAKAGISAAKAAEIIRFSTIGLKTGAGDTACYQERIEQFIRIYIAGLI